MTKPIGTISRTGEECPVSGKWKPVEDPSTLIEVYQGNPMPPFKGRSVSWQLESLPVFHT
jgi:hypothetical protein